MRSINIYKIKGVFIGFKKIIRRFFMKCNFFWIITVFYIIIKIFKIFFLISLVTNQALVYLYFLAYNYLKDKKYQELMTKNYGTFPDYINEIRNDIKNDLENNIKKNINNENDSKNSIKKDNNISLKNKEITNTN